MANKTIGASARTLCALAAGLSLFLGFARSANADVLPITADLDNRLSDKGMFSGEIDYAFNAQTGAGILNITLQNTTVAGGFITGFLFNVQSDDPGVKVTLIDGPSKFEDVNRRNGQPFGNAFDAGAGLRGHFKGGGNPRKGIASGETASFQFRVLASDASSLTSESFILGPFDHDLIVRFRGPNGGSDIVPALVSPVPGPSALAALAVAAVISHWRRRSAA